MSIIRGVVMAAVSLSLVATACDDSTNDSPRDAVAEEIIANLVDAGYERDEIEVGPEGEVLVHGDISMTLAASRELAQTFRHFRVTARILKNIKTIELYPDDPDLLINDAFNTALDGAATRWNTAVSSFGMTVKVVDTPSKAPFTAAIRFSASDTTGCNIPSVSKDKAGWADFPACGFPGQNVVINQGCFASAANDDVRRHIIMHEVGHALGFRHTDYDTRRSCAADPDNSGQYDPEDADPYGAVHLDGTPDIGGEWDRNSVMNACYNSSSSGEWTSLDLQGIRSMLKRD